MWASLGSVVTSTVDVLENCNLICIESTACFLQIVLLCKLQMTTNNSPLIRLPVHLDGREAFSRSNILLFPGRLLCCYELVTDTRNLLARHFYRTFMVTSISGLQVQIGITPFTANSCLNSKPSNLAPPSYLPQRPGLESNNRFVYGVLHIQLLYKPLKTKGLHEEIEWNDQSPNE